MSIPTSIPSTSLDSPLIVIRPASLFETTMLVISGAFAISPLESSNVALLAEEAAGAAFAAVGNAPPRASVSPAQAAITTMNRRSTGCPRIARTVASGPGERKSGYGLSGGTQAARRHARSRYSGKILTLYACRAIAYA